MSETRKVAAILVADVVGYGRLAGADEEGTLARLRALRSDLIDPAITTHHGRTVKRTGDGILIEFRSVVAAVRCAIEVQNGMVERNAGLPRERRIEFRIGVHLGDVVEESDGDLMGDGVNVAARLEGIAEPGGTCLSEDAWRQVRDKVKEAFVDLGEKTLKNVARPVRVYAYRKGLDGAPLGPIVPPPEKRDSPRLSLVVLPFANIGGDPEQEYFVDGVTENSHDRSFAHPRLFRDRVQHRVHLQGQACRSEVDWPRAERALHSGRKRTARRRAHARQRAIARRRDRRPSVG